MYLLKVLGNPPELPVMFEPSGSWYQLADNKVSYTVTSEFLISSWDWIALYQVGTMTGRNDVRLMWQSQSKTIFHALSASD